MFVTNARRHPLSCRASLWNIDHHERYIPLASPASRSNRDDAVTKIDTARLRDRSALDNLIRRFGFPRARVKSTRWKIYRHRNGSKYNRQVSFSFSLLAFSPNSGSLTLIGTGTSYRSTISITVGIDICGHLLLVGNTRGGFDRIAISLGWRWGGSISREDGVPYYLLYSWGKSPSRSIATLELSFDSPWNCPRNFVGRSSGTWNRTWFLDSTSLATSRAIPPCHHELISTY